MSLGQNFARTYGKTDGGMSNVFTATNMLSPLIFLPLTFRHAVLARHGLLLARDATLF